MKYIFLVLIFTLPQAIRAPRAQDLSWVNIKYIKELTLFVRAINSEAIGQSFDEKLRVGSVILNRKNSGDFPSQLDSVIYQPNQFKGINGPNFKVDTTPKGKESIKAAIQLLKTGSILPSNILYFHNPKVGKDKKWMAKIKKKLYLKGDGHWYFKK